MCFHLSTELRIWIMLLLICIAGAIGGFVNALLTDGLIKPYKEQNGEIRVYQPGYIGNIVTGAIAAGVSWGLYGPVASFFIFNASNQEVVYQGMAGLTLSSFVGAVLVGVGGAKWLTNEAEKKILKQVVVSAERRASASGDVKGQAGKTEAEVEGA